MENKCSWANKDPIETYHDTEHGKLPATKRRLFELLVLEIFQPGLSFNIVLQKRSALKAYFHNYDIEKIAQMEDSDVANGLENPQIIRHQLKIRSVIANANLLFSQNIDLQTYIFDNIDYRLGLDHVGILLSKKMKKDGFRFVGPSVVTSLLEAIGLLPAHFENCCYNDNYQQRVCVETPFGIIAVEYQNFKILSSSLVPYGSCQINTTFDQLIKYHLDNYFNHKIYNFKFDLLIIGTDFAMGVIDVTRNIEFGKTMTYGDVGFSIGSGAARAVGSCLKKTNHLIFIPAHRVVSSSGIGGFQNQLELKYQLLKHEGIIY